MKKTSDAKEQIHSPPSKSSPDRSVSRTWRCFVGFFGEGKNIGLTDQMCHGQARRYIGDGKIPSLVGNPYNGYFLTPTIGLMSLSPIIWK